MTTGRKRLLLGVLALAGIIAFMGGGYLDQVEGLHALGYVLGIVGFLAIAGATCTPSD